MPEAQESSLTQSARQCGPLRTGSVLALIGLAVVGVGMLVAPSSNLLGGLGPVGALLMTIGVMIVGIAGLARVLPTGKRTPLADEVADVPGRDENGEAASARRQP
ncbi:MAG: hypothetical protein H6806_04050 [Planctomycetes bacterium]|nr:hypothetical protein [Planctomycetota bacterium]MCB9825038.1 hypothetical protein [Planctomycetota bacterium]MCB9828927.1 hypothetical protein [Planctomycetota bacterium]